jgi:hypothetical protein
MALGTGRRRVAAAIVSLAVIVAGVVIGLSAVGGSASAPSVTTTTTPATDPTTATAPPATSAAPSAADVAAARACQAFVVYLEDAQNGRVPAAVGRTLIADAGVLLQGANQDRAAGRALPKWSALASHLIAAADDVVAHRTAALQTDGGAVGTQCQAIPAAAARAGGFSRTT